VKEKERNKRLLILMDKLISMSDIESIELLETMVISDTEAMKYTFGIMKNSYEHSLSGN